MQAKLLSTLLLAGVINFATSTAIAADSFHQIDTSAVLGGAIGGGAGAAVGSAIGGRNGAILGSAVGAAAGVVIATPNETKVIRKYRREHTGHGNHHEHNKHHHHED